MLKLLCVLKNTCNTKVAVGNVLPPPFTLRPIQIQPSFLDWQQSKKLFPIISLCSPVRDFNSASQTFPSMRVTQVSC